jgi:hypothetical protein
VGLWASSTMNSEARSQAAVISSDPITSHCIAVVAVEEPVSVCGQRHTSSFKGMGQLGEFKGSARIWKVGRDRTLCQELIIRNQLSQADSQLPGSQQNW